MGMLPNTPGKPKRHRTIILNDRQNAFIREFLVDMNASQAYIRAGYSPKGAGQSGYKLLNNPEIQKALTKLIQERAEKTEITAERVLTEIGHLAFFDPSDLFNEDGTLKPVKAMPAPIRRCIAAIEVQEMYEGIGDDRKLVGYLKKVKLASKEGGLTLAGKHLRLFSEQLEVRGGLTLEQLITKSFGQQP